MCIRDRGWDEAGDWVFVADSSMAVAHQLAHAEPEDSLLPCCFRATVCHSLVSIAAPGQAWNGPERGLSSGRSCARATGGMVCPCEGLCEEHMVKPLASFSYASGRWNSVTSFYMCSIGVVNYTITNQAPSSSGNTQTPKTHIHHYLHCEHKMHWFWKFQCCRYCRA